MALKLGISKYFNLKLLLGDYYEVNLIHNLDFLMKVLKKPIDTIQLFDN